MLNKKHAHHLDIEALAFEVNATKALRGMPAFQRCLQHDIDARDHLKHHYDPTPSTQNIGDLINTQFDFWKDFANDMIAAQSFFIGKDRGQSGNKAAHSQDVGFGVALFFDELATMAGISPCENEHDYICHRGQIHDGGRILNMDRKILNKPHTGLGNKTAYDFMMPTATAVYDRTQGQVGTIDDINDALCCIGLSNRFGPLYELAYSICEDIRTLGLYFSGMSIHNPIHLNGLHNFTAHHNQPFAKPGEEHNHNDEDTYGAIDLICTIVDRSSGCTSTARYLDEVALHIVKQSQDGECDPRYTKLFVRGYGSGDSVIERWYKENITRGYARMPEGLNALHFNETDFVSTLRGSKEGPNLFPRLFTEWSPATTDEARHALADEIEAHDTFYSYLTHLIDGLPDIHAEDIASDILTTQSGLSRS